MALRWDDKNNHWETDIEIYFPLNQEFPWNLMAYLECSEHSVPETFLFLVRAKIRFRMTAEVENFFNCVVQVFRCALDGQALLKRTETFFFPPLFHCCLSFERYLALKFRWVGLAIQQKKRRQTPFERQVVVFWWWNARNRRNFASLPLNSA